mmetsp:Transcript_5551/g.16705  ORF Transcript_5551/g.16705 Transcript_5551/m.16705 type:complete len:444 (-) Transcript_5551:16-1347(-)
MLGMPGGMPGAMPGMPGAMPGMMLGPGGMPGMMPGMVGMPGGGMPGAGGMPGMPGMPGPGAAGTGPGVAPGAIMPFQDADGAQTGPGEMPGMMPGMPPNMMPAMMARMMAPNPMMMMMAMMSQAAAARQSQQQDPEQGADAAPPQNPLLAGMMGGNPMLGGCNPMLAGMVPQQSPVPPKEPQKEPEDEIDPEVRELGDYFNIEDRWIKRLNETMRKRQDTKSQDLAKLYEVLERARSPTGLLTVKIGEMECGQFVGKIKPDKDVERLARKFKLDDHVVSRLTELVVRRKPTKEDDLDRIEQHLRYCKRPSAMATLLAGKLLEGEVDQLPDLGEAEVLMDKFRLDEDARSKLREIVEKRAADKTEVLAQIKKHLETSTFPSSMLCKIARPLIDGEKLPDPPERPTRPQSTGLNPVAVESRGGRDRSRDRERGRRERSRDRDRER